jgi:hypothetical protein
MVRLFNGFTLLYDERSHSPTVLLAPYDTFAIFRPGKQGAPKAAPKPAPKTYELVLGMLILVDPAMDRYETRALIGHDSASLDMRHECSTVVAPFRRGPAQDRGASGAGGGGAPSGTRCPLAYIHCT